MLDKQQLHIDPQVQIDARQDKPRAVGTDGQFERVILWPILQSFAVGIAGFLLTYAPLNFFMFGKPLIGGDQSWVNFHFSALIGIVVFALACIVFFMLDEMAFIVAKGLEKYAAMRNSWDDKSKDKTIQSMLADWKQDVDELERMKAELAAYQSLQFGPTATGSAADWAVSILMNALAGDQISRRAVVTRQGITETQWSDGMDHLLQAGVVEKSGNKYSLIADPEQAINAIRGA